MSGPAAEVFTGRIPLPPGPPSLQQED
jgi:hypothetical protein